MVDVPGNATTTHVINVGDTISNALEVSGDQDWFRITLTAGQKITIAVNIGTLRIPTFTCAIPAVRSSAKMTTVAAGAVQGWSSLPRRLELIT